MFVWSQHRCTDVLKPRTRSDNYVHSVAYLHRFTRWQCFVVNTHAERDMIMTLKHGLTIINIYNKEINVSIQTTYKYYHTNARICQIVYLPKTTASCCNI